MERLSWATQAPGSFETDLVHHCGPVTAGEYVHTLQLVDIATGWSERVAMLGRSQIAMAAAFRRVQERLPFPITHLHPDNGSEFFNDHLIRYFGEAMTAQTPYQRLPASSILSSEQQARLVTLYAETNPRRLREAIYHALERLWDRPKAPQAHNPKEAATTLR